MYVRWSFRGEFQGEIIPTLRMAYMDNPGDVG